uniref:Fibronectin type-II domain-containing protein n=1 Tax=Varanus komodoensis TaxID=61221 RepID=A0A8D2J1P1_VARKO
MTDIWLIYAYLILCSAFPLPCVFPFTYKQKVYSSCTKDDSSDGQPWCATTSNYDEDQQWRSCVLNEDYFYLCVFPFVYKSRTFYTCTNEDAELGRFWCATTGSFDNDKEWSYCADTRHDLLQGNSLANSQGPCVFPFRYREKQYSSCTTAGDSGGKLWCSLTSNYDVDRKWAYCNPSEHRPCIFPFIYKEKLYFKCTREGAADNTLWCSTTSNYDVDGKWKACSTQGKSHGGGKNLLGNSPSGP